MIFFLLTLTILLLLVIFTILNFRKTKKVWLIILMTFCYGIWTVANFLYPRLENYEAALFFSRLIFSSTSLWGLSLVLLALFHPFPLKNVKLLYFFIFLFVIWSVLTFFASQFTSSVILNLEYSEAVGQYIFKFNTPIFYHYIFYVISCISVILFILYSKYKVSSGRTLLQLKYLVIGMLFFSLTAPITNMLLPMAFNIFQYTDLGTFLASSILVTITYSLMIDRLHDLRYLFHNALLWGIKIFFIFFCILALFLISVKFLYGEYPSLHDEIILGILLISILISYFTYRFNVRDVLQGRKKGEMVLKLENKISVELKLEKLGILISQYIKGALGVEDVLIMVFDQENRNVIYKTEKNGFKAKRELDTRDLLEVVEFWGGLSQEPILAKDELKSLEVKSEGKMKVRIRRILTSMERDGIEIIVPLNRKVVLNGIIVIGGKSDTLPFTIQDYNHLEKIIRIASVAFSRAILYQEVKEFTKTLQKKVDEQTKQLRREMGKMEEMRQREKDMIDIMGHELRTPLTIAKNSIEMIDIYKGKLKKKKKHIKWNEDFEKQFNYLKTAIRREIGIVEMLLAATKLDANRMEANFVEVDLVEVIENTKLAFEKEAKVKGLKLKIDMDNRKAWKVKADILRIQQVVDNLLSNAVKYTQKGYIKISIEEFKDEIGIFVIDSGEGMSKDELENLGKKFYRAKQYIGDNGKARESVVRPGGTGLGLYVVFGLVKMMEGRYEVDSKIGKGSEFRVFFKKFKQSSTQKS